MKRLVLASLLVAASLPTAADKFGTLKLAVSKITDAPDTKFIQASSDLNGDRYPDALVLLQGSDWCGSGGCTLLIFRGTATGYSLISRSTIVSQPIRLLKSSHFGWKDLIVHTKGVGDVLLIHNKTKYPSNPSLQPKATSKQIQESIELKPEAPN